jgi:hypothetical protein
VRENGLGYATARLEIDCLNDLLGLTDGVRIIGARITSETEITLYLIGSDLPGETPLQAREIKLLRRLPGFL